MTRRFNDLTISLNHSITESLNDLLFAYCGRFLTLAGAQIIESGATHATLLLYLYFCDTRRMQRKHTLHAFAVRDSADRECFVESSTLAANDYAGEDLDSLLVPFHHTGVNTHAIPDRKRCYVAFMLLFLNGIDDLIHNNPFPRPPGRANSFRQDRQNCNRPQDCLAM